MTDPNPSPGDITSRIASSIYTNGRGLVTASILASILSAMVALSYFTQVGAGAIQRTIFAKLEDVVSAADFGVVNDATCSIDQTTVMRNAIAATPAGGSLRLPLGARICLNTAASTLQITASRVTIDGQNSQVQWNAPNGTAIAPVIDVARSAVGVRLKNIRVDHGVGTHNGYLNSAYFGNNPWGNVAVVIQGDDFLGTDLQVTNAYNNCIGIGAMNGNVAVTGSPLRAHLTDISTQYCGSGDAPVNGSYPIGKGGASVDNGSGGGSVIENLTDFMSYNCIIGDIGAGGYANWSNIDCEYTQTDSVKNPLGTGLAIYNGGPGNNFNNVTVNGATNLSVGAAWNDYFVAGITQWSNIYFHSVQGNCLYLKGAGTFVNIDCQDGGQHQSNVYAGIYIDTAAGILSGLFVTNFHVEDLLGLKRGTAIAIAGNNNVIGSISAGPLTGLTAAYNLPTTVTGLTILQAGAGGYGINSQSASYPVDIVGKTRVQDKTANVSYKTATFGDTGSNGSLFIQGTGNSRAGLGYDPINDVFVAQGVNQGVKGTPMMLNPGGGTVHAGQYNANAANASGFFAIAADPDGQPGNQPVDVQTNYVAIRMDTLNHKMWTYWPGTGWLSVTFN